jgi:glycosyltransferase involved in cell wall biosynthesis
MPPPPRIGIVSLSAIADDPRVRRQGDLLTEAGWNVVAIGLPGARSTPPSWACLTVDTPVRPPPPFLIRRFRQARRVLTQLLMSIDKRCAITIYWTMNQQFRAVYSRARLEKADLWLANDWTSLPIVKAIAEEQGVPFAYDTHELAVEEYAQRRLWRILQRPVIAAIERQCVRGAAFVTCVSQGIADRLAELYRPKRVPFAIRNVPHYEAYPFRPTGNSVRVLYHGIVAPGRGLEACIRSVADWRPEFTLTIRGPSSGNYADTLQALVKECGLSERVVLAPSVPMIDLVREASAFDIGLFALPGHSLQNFHVLPNKFFEYIMAGLALCVSDLPEMSRLLKHHDLGRLIDEVTPSAIAAAINGFDRDSIDRYKRNALQAARELNWEVEALRFSQACADAIPHGQPSPQEAR